MTPTGSASRREFARLVGASLTIVQRLVSRGQLPLDENGKIPIAAGSAAFAKVRPLGAPAAASGVAPAAAASSAAPASERAAAGPARAPAQGHEAVIATELRRKEADARLKELKVAKESGALVELEAVRQDAQTVCTAVRHTLLALPARVALQLEQLVASSNGQVRAARIQRLIEDEVNLAFEALQESRFAASAPPLAVGATRGGDS